MPKSAPHGTPTLETGPELSEALSIESARPRGRRGGGQRAQRACNRCRNKKAKCNGQQPCNTCITNDRTCVYSALRRRDIRKWHCHIHDSKDEAIQRLYKACKDACNFPGILPEEVNGMVTTENILRGMGFTDPVLDPMQTASTSSGPSPRETTEMLSGADPALEPRISCIQRLNPGSDSRCPAPDRALDKASAAEDQLPERPTHPGMVAMSTDVDPRHYRHHHRHHHHQLRDHSRDRRHNPTPSLDMVEQFADASQQGVGSYQTTYADYPPFYLVTELNSDQHYHHPTMSISDSAQDVRQTHPVNAYIPQVYQPWYPSDTSQYQHGPLPIN